MEFLSKILNKLKPDSSWNSFQEEKSINLSKKIRLLIQSQRKSNEFIKKLLSIGSAQEVSALIMDDAENAQLVLGGDPALFKKLVNEYPSFYLEYSNIIDNLLKGNNLSAAIRSYGIIPVLTNIAALFKKELISQEKFLEIIQMVYPPKALKSLIALSGLIKNAISHSSRQEALQIALEQGIIDIFDLAYDEEDSNILKNYIKKNVKLPNDKYSEDRIYDMFNDLKHFLIPMKHALSPVLDNAIGFAINKAVKDTKKPQKKEQMAEE